MAWIQSNQGLERNVKTYTTAERLQWELDKLIGFLHRFWWWALEQAETGSLKKYSNSALSKALKVDEAVIQVLCDEGWIDTDRKIHDWWEYAGGYLKSKYRTSNPDKLTEIMNIYGIVKNFGSKPESSQTKDRLKTDLAEITQNNVSEREKVSQSKDRLTPESSPSLVSPDKIDKIDKTDKIRQTNFRQTNESGQSANLSINYDNPTLSDKILFIYKYMRGYAKNDSSWDIANKSYLKKYYEQAQDIIEMFKIMEIQTGKIDEIETLQEIKHLFVIVTDIFKKKNLNWNLDTFKKYALEYKNTRGENV